MISVLIFSLPPHCNTTDPVPISHRIYELIIEDFLENYCSSNVDSYFVTNSSLHVTTAELSWHVQNCDVIIISRVRQYIWQDLNYELLTHWQTVRWLVIGDDMAFMWRHCIPTRLHCDKSHRLSNTHTTHTTHTQHTHTQHTHARNC